LSVVELHSVFAKKVRIGELGQADFKNWRAGFGAMWRRDDCASFG